MLGSLTPIESLPKRSIMPKNIAGDFLSETNFEQKVKLG